MRARMHPLPMRAPLTPYAEAAWGVGDHARLFVPKLTPTTQTIHTAAPVWISCRDHPLVGVRPCFKASGADACVGVHEWKPASRDSGE